ncbi:hypothetical protein DL96DRAFT_1715952 [Flagelloscypha sp. PMI_526]|nr:hypothetical protein DL96DRAFT_1715952 [Flagelloscypha sp. PMI_526]
MIPTYLETGRYPQRRKPGFKAYLLEDIDARKASFPLTAYFLMSGFLSAITFSATYSGNFTQLMVAIPRLFEVTSGSRDTSFRLPDRQALTCLISFFLGILFGRNPLSRHFGGSFARLWLLAVLVFLSDSPNIAPDSLHVAWKNSFTFVALGTIAFSMGLQATMARNLNTPFGATGTFVELFSDPELFHIRRYVYTRDSKLLGCLSLGMGAFAARSLIVPVGDGGLLIIAVGLRVVHRA